ncbi:hypothetical protein OG308_18960 [Nocardia salmonicida]|uniref:Uncharacterized protein n=1 Tax=Nocardia salmonicida TaxID=53431 RepID=A0ABZ1N0M4_9NOCA
MVQTSGIGDRVRYPVSRPNNESEAAKRHAARAVDVRGLQQGDNNTQNNYLADRMPWVVALAVLVLATGLVAVAVLRVGDAPEGTADGSVPPALDVTPDSNAKPAPPERLPLGVVDVAPIAMDRMASKFTLSDVQVPDFAQLGRTRFEEVYRQIGGIPVGVGMISFTVRGNIHETVRITRMTVEKECGEPLANTLMREYTQGGGTLRSRSGSTWTPGYPSCRQLLTMPRAPRG